MLKASNKTEPLRLQRLKIVARQLRRHKKRRGSTAHDWWTVGILVEGGVA